MSRTLTICFSIAMAMLLLAATVWIAASAFATTVFVDDNGSCGGNSPCYNSLQDGVNRASANGTVLIFPGTYNESVDLARMGSAIGSSPGNLTLRSVNINGAAVAGTAKLSPSAGAALYTSEIINANLLLEGLDITSPTGADGLNLDVAGDVWIKAMTAHDLGDEGINLNIKLPADLVAPSVVVENTTVQNSNGDGFRIAMVTGTIEILNSSALNNGSDGFDLDTDMGITLTNLTANANGKSGILARDASRVFLVDSVANNNADDGVDIDTGVFDVRIEDSSASQNGDDGFDLRAKDDVRVHRSTSENNAEQGFEVGANDNVEVHSATARSNGLDGIAVYTYTNPVNDIQIEGNLIIDNNRNRGSAGGIGIYADLRDSGVFSITSNAICDNHIAGLFVDSTVPTTPTLIADGNWWGSSVGPTGSNNRISDAPSIVSSDGWISRAQMEPSAVSVLGSSRVDVRFVDQSGNWVMHKGIGDENGERPFEAVVSIGRIVDAAGDQHSMRTAIDEVTESVGFTYDPAAAYPTSVSVTGPCGLSYEGELAIVNDTVAVGLVSAETSTPQTHVFTTVAAALLLASATILALGRDGVTRRQS